MMRKTKRQSEFGFFKAKPAYVTFIFSVALEAVITIAIGCPCIWLILASSIMGIMVVLCAVKLHDHLFPNHFKIK